MKRREFVKMIGAGGLLVGLTVLVGGCGEDTEPGAESPDPMEDAQVPPGEAGTAPPPPPDEGAPPDPDEGE